MRDTGDIFVPAKSLRITIPAVDCHVHTLFSDGRAGLDDYLVAARKDNFQCICFTDHVDGTTQWFDSYKAIINSSRERYPEIALLAGIEVRAKDFSGTLNAPNRIIENAELVIGVVHSIPTEDGTGKIRPEHFSPQELLEKEVELCLALLNSDQVSVLGHPLGNFEQWYGPAPRGSYEEIFTMAKTVEKAIEINPKYIKDLPEFLSICFSINPLVSLASDAHEVAELGHARQRVGECL